MFENQIIVSQRRGHACAKKFCVHIITVQINLQFTVTVYEADSTTCTEFNSTVCYEESDSDDSLSSQPMFVEDTHDTDDHDELPHVEVAKVEGPGPVVHGVTAAAATVPDPDACPMHFDCNKC